MLKAFADFLMTVLINPKVTVHNGWPKVTVHKCAETIQGTKLFKGGKDMRKYGTSKINHSRFDSRIQLSRKSPTSPVVVTKIITLITFEFLMTLLHMFCQVLFQPEICIALIAKQGFFPFVNYVHVKFQLFM